VLALERRPRLFCEGLRLPFRGEEDKLSLFIGELRVAIVVF
jgi:hypothetical protein